MGMVGQAHFHDHAGQSWPASSVQGKEGLVCNNLALEMSAGLVQWQDLLMSTQLTLWTPPA